MNFFKVVFAALFAAAFWNSAALAQVAPAEEMLPDDTVGFLTVPDWRKLSTAVRQGSWGQLWFDPAVKPFRDSFNSNFVNDFVRPLEKQLGLKTDDYRELLQGQITLALTPPREGSSHFASLLLVIDTGDKAEQLTAKLAELKEKWSAGGKELRTEKIREIEFNIVTFSGRDISAFLSKAFPDEDEGESEQDSSATEKTELHIGQYKSLLIAGENSKAIEKLLARQAGGLVTPLAERSTYQKAHNLLFRNSLAHAWLNVKPVYERLLKFASQEREEPPPGMPAIRPDKVLPALGFSSLETIAAKFGASSEGSAYEFFVGVPDGQRQGIFKLLTLENKEAAPPAFIPADAVKFQRVRVDAQKSWVALETMLSQIDPSLAGLLQLMLSSAGKDQDPDFDLKKNLIGNFGDDFIAYEKLPRSASIADLAAPPSLFLIGSPNPAQLLDALRVVMSLMPPPISTAPLKEREFLGKKIYSVTMASPPGEDAPEDPNPSTSILSFAASAGYIALSRDNSILEEFLRSGETPPKPLGSVPGLADASQKVGGAGTGFFTYENQAETLRKTFEALKDSESGVSLPFVTVTGDDEGKSIFTRLFNVKLLPEFDRISKYFHIAVASAATTPEGFTLKALMPTPPDLRR